MEPSWQARRRRRRRAAAYYGFNSANGNRLSVENSSSTVTGIAQTGVDINSSDQVTATHLAAGLPRAQGGLNSTSAGTGILRDGTTPTASELSGDATTSGSVTLLLSATVNSNMRRERCGDSTHVGQWVTLNGKGLTTGVYQPVYIRRREGVPPGASIFNTTSSATGDSPASATSVIGRGVLRTNLQQIQRLATSPILHLSDSEAFIRCLRRNNRDSYHCCS